MELQGGDGDIMLPPQLLSLGAPKKNSISLGLPSEQLEGRP